MATDLVRVFARDRPRRCEQPARLRSVGEEVGRVVLNPESLSRRKPAGRQRRDAAQRVIERDHHVVDEFCGRHDHLIVLDLRQRILLKRVVHITVRRDERAHAQRVQHVHGDHDAAVVALLQDVRVAVDQFGGHPLFHEGDPGLVVIRLPQDGRECGAVCFRPDAVDVALDEFQP